MPMHAAVVSLDRGSRRATLPELHSYDEVEQLDPAGRKRIFIPEQVRSVFALFQGFEGQPRPAGVARAFVANLTHEERATVLALADRLAEFPGPLKFVAPKLTGGTRWIGGELGREHLYGDDVR